MKLLASVVIDNLVDHYFKAELLVWSLVSNAGFQSEDIFLNFTTRVPDPVVQKFRDMGCQVSLIEPFLDGKYCNKVNQFDALENIDNCTGLILLDVDIFLLERPVFKDVTTVWGKIVDAPNPPLDVLGSVFTEAGIDMGAAVESDWGLGQTIDCNFNGGFIFIPGEMIKPLAHSWKAWSTWLYERRELIPEERFRIHVDQIAFGIAVRQCGFKYGCLAANYNYPLHGERPPASFCDDLPVYALHYHHNVDVFGCFFTGTLANESLSRAVELANQQLTREWLFYSEFKREKEATRINNLLTDDTVDLTILNGLNFKDGLDLVVHAGTPKTGTTSLQFFLHKNRTFLDQHGILYPDVLGNNYAPKHQWLVNCLMSGDVQLFYNKFKEIAEQMDGSKQTIFLSTEGYFNHWWDFSATGLRMLQWLRDKFNVKILIVFREPVGFSKSLYMQNVKNYRVEWVPCYGRDLSFDEMARDTWFIRHLDYLGFVTGNEALLGGGHVFPYKYSGDTLSIARSFLGLDELPDQQRGNKNISPCALSIFFLRKLNRLNIRREYKNRLVRFLEKVDPLISRFSEKFDIESSSQDYVHNKIKKNNVLLTDNYGIEF